MRVLNTGVTVLHCLHSIRWNVKEHNSPSKASLNTWIFFDSKVPSGNVRGENLYF